MKSKIYTWAVAAMAAVALSAATSCTYRYGSEGNAKPVKGSGKYVKVKRSVTNFDAIEVDGVFDVIYAQREGSPEVIVETDDNVVEYIITRVEGNTLNIDNKNVNIKSDRRRVYVYSPTIRKIESESVGSVRITSPLNVSSLSIELDGVGSFKAEKPISASGHVSVSHDGVGSMTLPDMTTASSFKLEQEGIGSFKAGTISCSGDVRIETEGVGSTSVDFVKCDDLSVIASGVGSTKVSKVDAANVITSHTGVGSCKVGENRRK